MTTQSEQNNKEQFLSAKELVERFENVLTTTQRPSKYGEVFRGIPTGWKDLDEVIMGMQSGDLVVVAGRPEMGKTAFCLNIATNAALNDNKNVVFFSLEESVNTLAARLLASLGEINLKSFHKGRFTEQECEKQVFAKEKLSKSSLYFDDSPNLTPDKLRTKCQELVNKQGKIDLVFLDYFQLLETSNHNCSRKEQMAKISYSLKSLAKELDCPIIISLQLSRALEQRPNKRPVISDLREIGDLEQSADLITFIYRESVYANEDNNYDKNNPTAEIIVARNPNGEEETVKLNFVEKYAKFVDVVNFYHLYYR